MVSVGLRCYNDCSGNICIIRQLVNDCTRILAERIRERSSWNYRTGIEHTGVISYRHNRKRDVVIVHKGYTGTREDNICLGGKTGSRYVDSRDTGCRSCRWCDVYRCHGGYHGGSNIYCRGSYICNLSGGGCYRCHGGDRGWNEG